MTLSYKNKSINIVLDVEQTNLTTRDSLKIFIVGDPDNPSIASPSAIKTIYPLTVSEGSDTFYRYQCDIYVNRSGEYSFSGTFYDSYNNAGDTVDLGSITVYLQPVDPTLEFSELDFVNLSGAAVAQYKMNDNNGASTVVTDSFGYSNGTSSETTGQLHVAGLIDGGFYFQGSHFIDTNDKFTSTMQNNLTYNIWCKDLLTNSTLFDISGLTSNFAMVLSSENKIITSYISNENAVNFFDTNVYTTYVTASNWNMWTFTVEQSGANVVAKTYINSVLINTTSAACLMSEWNTDFNVVIGAQDNTLGGGDPLYNAYCRGKLDNAIIFSKALSQTEINTLYNSGIGSEDLLKVSYAQILNGDFSSTDNWTLDGSCEILNNKLVFNDSDTSQSATQTISLIQGQKYKIVYTLSDFNPTFSGEFSVTLGGTIGEVRQSAGTYTEYLVAGSDQSIIFASSLMGAGDTFSVSNVYSISGEEYYNLYRYTSDTPSSADLLSSYDIDSTTFITDVPSAGEYTYYLTSVGYTIESEASNIVPTISDGSIVYQVPEQDVANLTLYKYNAGRIKCTFTYPYNANEMLPTHFALYYITAEDPSTNPSDVWIKDSETTYSGIATGTTQMISTTEFTNNQEVWVKIVPFCRIGDIDYERDTTYYLSIIADNLGPSPITVIDITLT